MDHFKENPQMSTYKYPWEGGKYASTWELSTQLAFLKEILIAIKISSHWELPKEKKNI